MLRVLLAGLALIASPSAAQFTPLTGLPGVSSRILPIELPEMDEGNAQATWFNLLMATQALTDENDPLAVPRISHAGFAKNGSLGPYVRVLRRGNFTHYLVIAEREKQMYWQGDFRSPRHFEDPMICHIRFDQEALSPDQILHQPVIVKLHAYRDHCRNNPEISAADVAEFDRDTLEMGDDPDVIGTTIWNAGNGDEWEVRLLRLKSGRENFPILAPIARHFREQRLLSYASQPRSQASILRHEVHPHFTRGSWSMPDWQDLYLANLGNGENWLVAVNPDKFAVEACLFRRLKGLPAMAFELEDSMVYWCEAASKRWRESLPPPVARPLKFQN